MVGLLIALNICHWLGDYTHLSMPVMLRAKMKGKPLAPILLHACVHGMLMGIALSCFGMPQFVVGELVYIQIATHFAIDILKGRMNVWFPSVANPANKSHWYIFGLDQLSHQIVIILMVSITLRQSMP